MTSAIREDARPKLALVHRLAEGRVPKASIAKVVNVLHDDERMDRHAVAKILRGHVPMHWRDRERAA